MQEEIKNQIVEIEVANLAVYNWQDIPREFKRGILSERLWVGTDPTTPIKVEPQVDLVVTEIKKEDNSEKIMQILAVYSCKSSAEERYQHKSRRIRFCFVTVDDEFLKYAQGKRSANKAINLTKALYGRVYLPSEPDQIGDGSGNFRSWETIGSDLRKWRSVL